MTKIVQGTTPYASPTPRQADATNYEQQLLAQLSRKPGFGFAQPGLATAAPTTTASYAQLFGASQHASPPRTTRRDENPRSSADGNKTASRGNPFAEILNAQFA
ncbi:MAG: hypothetical protein IPK79_05005 [Vampirovibrionales bacterium]|nr:hypothetical protein [Vampirovibrionales bacterium]